MNAKRVFGLVIAGLLAAAVAVPAAVAQEDMQDDSSRPAMDGGQRRGHGKMRGDKNRRQDFGLSTETMAKLKEIKTAGEAKAKPIIKELQTKVKALNEELKKEKYNADTARKIQSEIKALEGKLSDQRAEDMLALRAAMTAEEYAKFSERIARPGMEQRRGGRGEGPRSGDDASDESMRGPGDEPSDGE